MLAINCVPCEPLCDFVFKTKNPLSKEWISYILFRFECNLSRKENCLINGGDRDSLVFRLLVFGR